MLFLNNFRPRYTIAFLVVIAVLCSACDMSDNQVNANKISDAMHKSLYLWDKSDVQVMKVAAETGNPTAQVRLAKWMRDKDPELSFRLFRESALNGSSSGMQAVGYGYYDGRGVQQDFYQAAYWLSLYILSSPDGEMFAADLRDSAMGKLSESERNKVLEEVNSNIDSYKDKWARFCKENTEDPMC